MSERSYNYPKAIYLTCFSIRASRRILFLHLVLNIDIPLPLLQGGVAALNRVSNSTRYSSNHQRHQAWSEHHMQSGLPFLQFKCRIPCRMASNLKLEVKARSKSAKKHCSTIVWSQSQSLVVLDWSLLDGPETYSCYTATCIYYENQTVAGGNIIVRSVGQVLW